MSRIGLKPITVPQGVEIKVNDGVVTCLLYTSDAADDVIDV